MTSFVGNPEATEKGGDSPTIVLSRMAKAMDQISLNVFFSVVASQTQEQKEVRFAFVARDSPPQGPAPGRGFLTSPAPGIPGSRAADRL